MKFDRDNNSLNSSRNDSRSNSSSSLFFNDSQLNSRSNSIVNNMNGNGSKARFKPYARGNQDNFANYKRRSMYFVYSSLIININIIKMKQLKKKQFFKVEICNFLVLN